MPNFHILWFLLNHIIINQVKLIIGREIQRKRESDSKKEIYRGGERKIDIQRRREKERNREKERERKIQRGGGRKRYIEVRRERVVGRKRGVVWKKKKSGKQRIQRVGDRKQIKKKEEKQKKKK